VANLSSKLRGQFKQQIAWPIKELNCVAGHAVLNLRGFLGANSGAVQYAAGAPAYR
jgi:hypothetical protein